MLISQNEKTLYLLHLGITVQRIFFTGTIFDPILTMSLFLVSLFLLVKFFHYKLSPRMKNLIVYIEHTLFISIIFKLVAEFLYELYSFIFRFGFTNTIIFSHLLVFVLSHSFFHELHESIYEILSRRPIGRVIIKTIRKIGTTYHRLNGKTCGFLQKIRTYLLRYAGEIWRAIYGLHLELSTNENSIMVKDKYNNLLEKGRQNFESVLFSQGTFSRISKLLNVKEDPKIMEILNLSLDELHAENAEKKVIEEDSETDIVDFLKDENQNRQIESLLRSMTSRKDFIDFMAYNTLEKKDKRV